MKKISLYILIFLGFFLYNIFPSFGALPIKSNEKDTSKDTYYNNDLHNNPLLKDKAVQEYIKELEKSGKSTGEIIQGFGMQADGKCGNKCAENLKLAAQKETGISSSAKAGSDTSSPTKKCEGEDCMNSTGFIIHTSTFSPGGTEFLGQGTAKETINLVLGTIVRRLIVALGIISLLIMSIGAGFMILYGGKDENLTKGKTILKMGFVALFVALSSYTIISIVIFILYH